VKTSALLSGLGHEYLVGEYWLDQPRHRFLDSADDHRPGRRFHWSPPAVKNPSSFVWEKPSASAILMGVVLLEFLKNTEPDIAAILNMVQFQY
jgi:hypothetical protein